MLVLKFLQTEALLDMKVSSVWVLLANDVGEAVTFSQTLPSDSSDSSNAAAAARPPGAAAEPAPAEDAEATEHRTVEPMGRQWVRAPLQVPAAVL